MCAASNVRTHMCKSESESYITRNALNASIRRGRYGAAQRVRERESDGNGRITRSAELASKTFFVYGYPYIRVCVCVCPSFFRCSAAAAAVLGSKKLCTYIGIYGRSTCLTFVVLPRIFTKTATPAFFPSYILYILEPLGSSPLSYIYIYLAFFISALQ